MEGAELEVQFRNYYEQADAMRDVIDDALKSKDYAEVKRLARQQAELYARSASSLYRSAEKVEQAGRLSDEQAFKKYTSLYAQAMRNLAEEMDVLRQHVEELLKLGIIPENKIGTQQAKLRAKAQELDRKAETFMQRARGRAQQLTRK